MSRLIDADVLVKIIDKHTNDENQLDDDITCILEEVPTAYNVDRVVKALEEEVIALEDNYGDLVECIPKDVVFDIVKGGGVNA